jgi:DNA polymerase III alpha subunit
MGVDFVHLRVRSEYSVGRGAIRVKALPGLCAGGGRRPPSR